MNKVILVGRLTKNIELRYTTNNKAFATFTVACDNGKDKNADFIKCDVWGTQAENLNKYMFKGSQLLVEGSIKNDEFQDQQGNKKYRNYVLVNRVEFLSRNSKNEENNEIVEAKETNVNEMFENISDEDLPF